MKKYAFGIDVGGTTCKIGFFETNGKLIDKITTYDEYLASDEMARKRFTFTVTESQEDDD